jgi:hypothetical protein
MKPSLPLEHVATTIKRQSPDSSDIIKRFNVQRAHINPVIGVSSLPCAQAPCMAKVCIDAGEACGGIKAEVTHEFQATRRGHADRAQRMRDYAQSVR